MTAECPILTAVSFPFLRRNKSNSN